MINFILGHDSLGPVRLRLGSMIFEMQIRLAWKGNNVYIIHFEKVSDLNISFNQEN